MKFRYDGFNWLVRLEKGEKLVESLTKLAKQEKLPSCWVSGIGGVLSAELGFYRIDTKDYELHYVVEPLEITALQGNLAWDKDEPVWHLHGTFGRQDMSLVGGHVRELIVGGTCEILLHKWYKEPFTRVKDKETGLKLLDL